MSDRLASFRAGASAATALLVVNREVPPLVERKRSKGGGRPHRSPPGPDLYVLEQIDLGDSVTSGGSVTARFEVFAASRSTRRVTSDCSYYLLIRDSVPSPPL